MATYGQLISFGPRFSGGRLCTLKVYHYVVGLTTLKDVYTDREKTTTAAQPAVSNSDGMVHFYADGLYKFRIDGSTDGVTYTTLDTIDKWAVVDQSLTFSGEGAAIASATTLVLGTDGDFFHVTGSTGPIGIISGSQVSVTLVFDSTPTLTHSGSLILQNGTSLVMTAGDVVELVNEGANVWRETSRLLAANPANSGVSNPVINGDFSIAQRGTTFTSTSTPANNDDTYLLDRWLILSDGNDTIDVVQEATTIPANGLYAISLDVETINRKFGILQVIEKNNCKGLIGNNCTLSFKMRISSGAVIGNVKAAILAWSGTADTVTSDIVSAWGVEGTNPTLVTSWTYENTPVNLSPTTTYATYSVTGVVDTASTQNIGIFIWSDDTATALTNMLFITDVKFEAGTSATAFQYRTFNNELELAMRYYQKSFLYATAPAQNVSVGMHRWQAPRTAGANNPSPSVSFSTPFRAAPTVTLYNPSANNAQIRDLSIPGDFTGSTASPITEKNMLITGTGHASTAIGNDLAVNWSADAEL